jgi:hypothetical protein
MFGWFKKKMDIGEFCHNLIGIVLRENSQDAAFSQQVADAGLNTDTFRLEHLALRVFSAVAAMRCLLDDNLWKEFLETAESAIGDYAASLSGVDRIVRGPQGFQSIDQFVWMRISDYMKVNESSQPGSTADAIAAFFSATCSGNNANSTLTRIGHSTYVVRGDSVMQVARRLRFLPAKHARSISV